MPWSVLIQDELDSELDAFEPSVRVELLAHAKLLMQFGPTLGRPYVDTLKGSKHNNMKELRFSAGDGVWRVAFAFDAERQAILLVAGDKRGVNQQRFYKVLIRQADDRLDRWLSASTSIKKDS